MATPTNSGMYRRTGAFLLRWLFRLPLFLITLWCALALAFDLPYVGCPLAALFIFVLIWQFRSAKRERYRLAWVAGGCLLVLGWWLLLPPRNDRDWNATSKVLAVPEFDGSKVTIRNLRNFLHTAPGKFTPRYYDATFDLDQLETVDLIFDDFLGPGPVSHTMLSFGFSDGRHVCLSIEPRRAVDNPYSIPRACFKGFEIIYHLGDERDMLYECTNVLDQDVYLYRLYFTRPIGGHP